MVPILYGETAIRVAAAYFALGEVDTGFEWLERSVDRGSISDRLKGDPLFDCVLDDPRFPAILERMGF